MDGYGVPHTSIIIALLVGLYLAIKMDPCGVPHTALTVALLGELYLDIIMNRFGGQQLHFLESCWEAST
jgi:hypothetical protein